MSHVPSFPRLEEWIFAVVSTSALSIPVILGMESGYWYIGFVASVLIARWGIRSINRDIRDITETPPSTTGKRR